MSASVVFATPLMLALLFVSPRGRCVHVQAAVEWEVVVKIQNNNKIKVYKGHGAPARQMT
jgi:hypothetical protein